MKSTVDFYEFRSAFERIRPDNFSREGLSVLWDYLEQYEDDCGVELELDVIGLCCDFNEDTWESIANDYRIDLDECEDDEEKAEAVREYLENEGALVGDVAGGFVYRSF